MRRSVVTAAVLLFVFTVVLRPLRVVGTSMLPNYKNGGFNLVFRFAYAFHEPRRGDVVTIRVATTGEVALMKRIVGMPGETIAFQQGRVLINGKELDEPYVDFEKYPCSWNIPPQEIGLNQYYVVGDNRDNSNESHYKGRADRNRIMGKVIL